jgi:hypothetical protein
MGSLWLSGVRLFGPKIASKHLTIGHLKHETPPRSRLRLNGSMRPSEICAVLADLPPHTGRLVLELVSDVVQFLLRAIQRR